MPKNHVIISGTGRAGTTFIIRLLTALKLDTGYNSTNTNIDLNAQAGMELDIMAARAPYIIKNPWLCDNLETLLEQKQVSIDLAIIPVRNLFDAAESRRQVVKSHPSKSAQEEPQNIPGGLWHTNQPEKQEAVLAEQFYKIMHALAKYDIPTIMLNFPRLVQEPEYLYEKLNPLIGHISYDQFQHCFHEIANPTLVHNFSSANN